MPGALAQRSAMRQNTVSNLLEEQVALANVQPPSNHRCFSEACFPRRRSAGIGRKALLGHIPQSPALERSSFLLGKAADAEGPDTAARRSGNGEIPFLWSEHRPARGKSLERPGKLRLFYMDYPPLRVLHRRGDLTGIATRELKDVSQLSRREDA